MNRILSFDELRVAQHNKTRKLVIAFAYDIELGEAICGNMILSTRSFQLKQIPLHLLTFYNLKDTNDLISDEKNNLLFKLEDRISDNPGSKIGI